MTDNIQRITEGLKSGYYRNNPEWSANDLSLLAGEYSWICGQLEDILQRKANVWNILRKDQKSDTATERAYQATEDGLNEQGLRLRMKRCEKMMSALKTLVRIATEEAHNNF